MTVSFDSRKTGIIDPAAVAITGGTADKLTLTNSVLSAPRTTTPDQIAGLQLWLDASQPMFTAGYGAVVANAGDQIGIWPDSSGNGRLGTASATKPTYDPVGMNGKPTINFNGNSTFLTPSFFDATYNSGVTIFCVAKHANGAGLKVIMGSAANGFYLGRNDGTKSASLQFANTTPTSMTVQSYVNSAGVDGCLYRGTTSTAQYDRLFQITVNGAGNSTATNARVAMTGVLGLTGALTIGDLAGGGFKWPGQISEILIYNGVLSDEQYRQVYDYLSAKWGFSAKKLVVCAGNSLTSGTNSSDGSAQAISAAGTNYPSQMLALLGVAGYDIRADANPGRLTSDMIALTPLYGDLYYSPTASPKNICVVWEITNTLVTGLSRAGAYNQLVTYCKARRAQGFKVVVLTCMPRAGSYAGFEVDRLAINALIRTNYTSFTDGLADIALDSRLQNTANLTYFGADGVHLTDAGYGVVAAIVAPVVAAL